MYKAHIQPVENNPSVMQITIDGHAKPCGRIVLDDRGFRAIVEYSITDHEYLGDFYARHKAVQAVCSAYADRQWAEVKAELTPA